MEATELESVEEGEDLEAAAAEGDDEGADEADGDNCGDVMGIADEDAAAVDNPVNAFTVDSTIAFSSLFALSVTSIGTLFEVSIALGFTAASVGI